MEELGLDGKVIFI